MTDHVPADEIERIVGVKRHPTRHIARAIWARLHPRHEHCTSGWSAEEYCDVGGRCRIWDSTNPYERTERADS